MTTDNTDRETLEPCPFCGVRLILLGDYNDENAWNWYGHPSADDSDCLLSQHRIRTGSDLATPMTVDRKAWNTRAAVAAPRGDDPRAVIAPRRITSLLPLHCRTTKAPPRLLAARALYEKVSK